MSEQQILYLSRAAVEAVDLPMREIVELLEKAFMEKGNGRVEMPPKPGIHTMPDAFIHAMPAYIPAMRSAGIKWVSGYPENYKRELPYITGLLILNDVETGVPYAVMDCAWITAMRTGAASALSAKYLARPESETVGILACGVQGRTNLEALACLFPIKRVYAYDIFPAAQERFIADMKARFNFEFINAKEPKQAVIDSDLVVTSGPILKNPSPVIEKDWLKPGAYGSAVDFDSYWSGAALAQMDLISTDDHAQFQYYKSGGYFQQTPTPYADLGELVAGIKPGRTDEKQRALAINLGLAMDDMAVAPEIYRRAKEKGLGVWLPL
ncbi:MAG: ornithine cyclodeaminase family protein [Chloroflexi bacterium]|nr:ornithine cyclodeaminase family protein [Chloroflexota bacterium]MCA2000823.1 ornithine cyclodeaminase family protein [Chloroflexota bacterium]